MIDITEAHVFAAQQVSRMECALIEHDWNPTSSNLMPTLNILQQSICQFVLEDDNYLEFRKTAVEANINSYISVLKHRENYKRRLIRDQTPSSDATENGQICLNLIKPDTFMKNCQKRLDLMIESFVKATSEQKSTFKP